ncbi:MAG: hypothetical protein Harvfovirus1_92 [Harvfovirus sp.]|uniref:Uncharacterized protein n=1 Tax=Harvfovirus sp. TaxID=2487768 RepID=A0A3G4ZZW6_9VIRU|nr:MAG: hypothetical protein Harvfovirus1_92 [Harvfovirus sp.]
MSFELIRYYARNKLPPTDNLFDHLKMINYYFSKTDIKSIFLEMNNIGRDVESLWNAIRWGQPQFAEYYATTPY